LPGLFCTRGQPRVLFFALSVPTTSTHVSRWLCTGHRNRVCSAQGVFRLRPIVALRCRCSGERPCLDAASVRAVAAASLKRTISDARAHAALHHAATHGSHALNYDWVDSDWWHRRVGRLQSETHVRRRERSRGAGYRLNTPSPRLEPRPGRPRSVVSSVWRAGD